LPRKPSHHSLKTENMNITDSIYPEHRRRERLETDIVLNYRELNKFTNLKLSTK